MVQHSEQQIEQAIYRRYDGERRLRLARIIAPLFGIITFLCLVLLVSYPLVISTHPVASKTLILPPAAGYWGMGILGIVVLLYAYSSYAAFHGQVRSATWSCAVAVLTATGVVGSVWVFSQGIGPFTLAAYVLLPLDIVLIGLLAESVITILATLAMNGLTIIFTFMAPREGGISAMVNREALLIVIFCILLEWCFTITMLALRQTMRTTLHELGDTRLAYERAQQLDDIKNQFIRSVNHELRNPLMALTGYVKVLKLQLETLPLVRQRAFLEQAVHVGDRVTTLLKNILDTGRLEQTATDFTPAVVPVRETVLEAAQLLDPLEGNLVVRDLQVDIAPDLSIWGESIRFQQIMTNLLSNAVKYSPEGMPVEVRARIVHPTARTPHVPWARPATPPPMIEITVRDQGQGIPPEQIPLLFNRFVRLPRELTSSVAGSGLGLFICRQLVEAMHGSIWVESTGIPGQGSTFYVRLPMPENQLAGEKAAEPNAVSSQKATLDQPSA
jgi:signal transduction histidine kinase